MDITTAVLVGGTFAAILFGLAKTGIPPVGAFGVAILASVLPPVASTGVALPVLMAGDIVAVSTYGRDVRWRIILGLIPTVTIGVLAGFAAVRWAPEAVSGRLVGAVLLLAALGEMIQRLLARRRARRAGPAAPPEEALSTGEEPDGSHLDDAVSPDTVPPHAGEGTPDSVSSRVARGALGTAAGFSTMVANSGGPAMTLYLMRTNVSRAGLLGTVAIFFLTVNLVKVPFSIGLGLITPESLRISAAMLPGLVVGMILGRIFARKAPGPAFDVIVLVATAAAGTRLLIG